ncbi:PH domain-containing protein [Promicromonospora sp. NPDC057488]|uniref:PH domain-containing protein n=1 Tax=Promicromonospora sp. NPDC057488 TaxID=3346147 RepID=UPI00367114FB
MSSEERYRVYKVGPAIKKLYPVWLMGAIGFGLVLIANIWTWVIIGMASWLWTPLSIAVLASLAFGYFGTKESWTLTTPDYIETRTLTRTRQTAWPDVKNIEVRGKAKTGRRVFVRTASGEQFRLPHVDSGGLESSFDDEVTALRSLWEQQRG